MKTRKNFTLIELLVVIAIIAILASMLLPTLGRARNTAKRIQCVSNLKQMGIVQMNYINDFDGWMPHNGTSAWINIIRATYPAEVQGDKLWSGSRYGKQFWHCPSERENLAADSSPGGCSDYGTSHRWGRDESGTSVLRMNRNTKRPSVKFSHGDIPLNNIRPTLYPTYFTRQGIPVSKRHDKQVNLMFFDGHVSAIAYDELFRRAWDENWGAFNGTPWQNRAPWH
ncbi:MAG: type II secretion system protein [Victivallales bacterium]|nr:type II secretion system protein [Victivallales bacterium]